MNAIMENMQSKYPELAGCAHDVLRAFEIIKSAFYKGNKLLICGNGGSASDSEHIVGELMKGFRMTRPVPLAFRRKLIEVDPEQGDYMADHLQGALPAISLVSQQGLISAFSNDVEPSMVYAQQVYGYGKPGDVLLGLSTSGNSVNVIRAVQVAKAAGMSSVVMTGKSGGVLKTISDVTIAVPWEETSDVQERHLPVYHALCLMLEEAFFA
ncbi:SIS domain-containing protein [Paenibacillus lautus]|uniref:D-sedoheptulose-7-phosphate isomerase n=1 Tax=Paenibacillus TaxID=44249 RepID=UPI0010E2B491|nr:SIS domain-containing protein [Paenibacillus sp. p3-SID867]MBY0161119.1 SIS domain-containing protein [Cytobacillus firmus]MCT1398711.1 SIS domain-containing protein [Paenibacillus sp. p3-SID867]VTR58122.1 phosphoheptose isomerase [Actinobacillus pleuropneumoniae]